MTKQLLKWTKTPTFKDKFDEKSLFKLGEPVEVETRKELKHLLIISILRDCRMGHDPVTKPLRALQGP